MNGYGHIIAGKKGEYCLTYERGEENDKKD